MDPTEGVEFADINELTHDAVWLSRIKFYRASKANGFDNKL